MSQKEWTEYPEIWLTPSCGKCNIEYNFSEGRLWCQHPQDPCEECGKEWVKFTLAQDKLEEPNQGAPANDKSAE